MRIPEAVLDFPEQSSRVEFLIPRQLRNGWGLTSTRLRLRVSASPPQGLNPAQICGSDSKRQTCLGFQANAPKMKMR